MPVRAKPELARAGDLLVWRFEAMASPCEVLIDSADVNEARAVGRSVAEEVWRIERKFSRYRDDSVLAELHGCAGRPFEVDAETARLFDYGQELHALSDGAFDLTSGVLRRAWTFDGSERIPEREAVSALQALIGWSKVSWNGRVIELPIGMQIDLGGIGKEYAADRALLRARRRSNSPVLINLGGDLCCSGPRRGRRPWQIGVDTEGHGQACRMVLLNSGALATSGDANRYLMRDGVRYSHVLDARTGWPVSASAHAVTVAAPSCIEAGSLATLALLNGAAAERFLAHERVPHWITR